MQSDQISTQYIDASLDSLFESSCFEGSGLTWLPWVGRNYKKQKDKILIVAESHYSNEVNPEKAKKDIKKWQNEKKLTRDVVTECPINGEWSNITFGNLHRALLGTTDFESFRLWQEIAFYNFIQRPMQYRYDFKERPTYTDFLEGWKTFVSANKILRPSLCIFIGLAASNTFNQAFDDLGLSHSKISWGDPLNNVYKRNPVTFKMDGHEVKILFIKHTSKYFSWELWNQYLNNEAHDEIESLKKIVNISSKHAIEKSIEYFPITSKKERTTDLPWWLTHKPVLACRYEDASLSTEDAKFISIGKATYDTDCASVKIWRRTSDDRKWSRQSEEIPIHRVGLCMQMLLSAIRISQSPDGEYPTKTALNEEIQTEDCVPFLKNAIQSDRESIKKSLIEISKLMDEIDIEKI